MKQPGDARVVFFLRGGFRKFVDSMADGWKGQCGRLQMLLEGGFLQKR